MCPGLQVVSTPDYNVFNLNHQLFKWHFWPWEATVFCSTLHFLFSGSMRINPTSYSIFALGWNEWKGQKLCVFLFYFQNSSSCQSRPMFCRWALLYCLLLLQSHCSKLQKGWQQESMPTASETLKSNCQDTKICLSFYRCPVRLLGMLPTVSSSLIHLEFKKSFRIKKMHKTRGKKKRVCTRERWWTNFSCVFTEIF